MSQKSNDRTTNRRGTGTAFWRAHPWRSLFVGCAMLGGWDFLSQVSVAQPNVITAPNFNGGQPNQSQGGLPLPPNANPVFAPAPPMMQVPTGSPTFLPQGSIPGNNIVPAQAAIAQAGKEPAPAGKDGPEKIQGNTPETAPQPRQMSPFAPNQVRVPLMSADGIPLLGTTPVPDKTTLDRFKKYIDRITDPQNTLDLVISRARLIQLKETPKRIQMADESVAIYNLVSPKEITILGRSAGSTVMNLWFIDENGKETVLSYLVRVFPDPEAKERLERVYKALENEINRIFPDSVIHLRLVGDKIVVTGQARDAVEATQIIRLVRSNAPNAQANPVVPVDGLKSVVRGGDPNNAVPGLENYEVHSTANVINMLRIPGEQQVMLKVTVAEVNRTAARSIGVNFTARNNNGLQYLANFTGGVAGLANVPVLLDNGQISLAINALKTLNYARSLAEPNLVTMNGIQASFQAGGSFPVPVVTGATATGLLGTTFVPFGVSLNFTPYITDKDRVRLVVNANVSTRDTSTGATVGGSSVPGLTTRNFNTTVELREGQTLAVAGLIQNTLGTDRANIPFFTDIPVLNRLTGQDKTSHGEQELVILVSPELVHPMEPKEVPPLPGSDIFEPNDCEFYFLGRLESRRPYDYRSPVMNDLDRQRRYRHCEQLYIFGPTGHSTGDAGAGCQPGH